MNPYQANPYQENPYQTNPYQKWVFVPTLNYWRRALVEYFHQPNAPLRQVPFVTQSLHETDTLSQTGRWVCTGRPPARLPPLLRVSYWIGSSLFVPGTHEYRADFASLSFTALKLIIAWPLLCLLVHVFACSQQAPCANVIPSRCFGRKTWDCFATLLITNLTTCNRSTAPVPPLVKITSVISAIRHQMRLLEAKEYASVPHPITTYP